MTLSVARIIPWRWDLKNDMITCESEQILAHMNFTKEEGSTPQAHIIKASEYFRKMHPEDLERMQQVHKNLYPENYNMPKKSSASLPKWKDENL